MFSGIARASAALSVAAVAGLVALRVTTATPAAASVMLPRPAVDEPRAPAPGEETAVLAGGCFWGVQAVFQHTKGVKTVVSGYAGGEISAPSYALVSSGMTGHAESVQITYDPSTISYGTLLRIFFSVAHDPTTINRQGPDRGPQYRSAIFYTSDEQRAIAEAYVKQLTTAQSFTDPIVTQIAPLSAFYPAEDYHQNYATTHPYSPYIMINDAPKVRRLERSMPEVWRAEIAEH